ncbi:Acetyltransferase YpeA [compost metagenome]
MRIAKPGASRIMSGSTAPARAGTNRPARALPGNGRQQTGTIVLEIIDVDFDNPEHGRQVLAMLDEYASGPMGGNAPLSDHARRHLIAELARRPAAHALLARVDGEAAGVAIYLEGFSTFACRPLVNLHDLGVSPRFQGLGVGKALLSALEERARRLGCCKITLEVLEGNAVAQGLYRKLGFEGYALDETTGRALFWQKKLAA